ncbi:MAG: ABC transporter ATP-binding protein [Alphaproteobacteria bacterium]|nr:ABC transporter ATP-binding protein [Alphaproteobacteria bacterium]
MARLEVEGICKGWDFPVIDDLSFSVEEGEFFVIVGPSGIGKTTLLRLISGLETPDQGVVRVGGRDMTALPPYRRRIAMTFESYALYPHMTVYENIASPLRARKAATSEIDERVRSVANLLRIEQLLQRKPGEVSGGQKQRTALGRTLVADPEVFLLDEPISHLDAKIRHELRTQFHALEDLRRVATVYVTHDYAEALSLGDRIGVMGAGGQLEQVGAPRDLFERPDNIAVARHMGQPTINVIAARLKRRDGGMRVDAAEGTLSFRIDDSHAPLFERYTKDDVTVGLRPQFLRPVKDGQTAADTIEAEVDIFEPLGASGIMLAKSGGVRLTALTDPEAHYDAGDRVTLAVSTDRFHFFDAVTGRNLAGSA